MSAKEKKYLNIFNRMWLFGYIIAVIFMVSCSTLIKEKLPEGVLNEDQMVNVMVDVHLLEARANIMNAHLDSARLDYSIYKDSMCKKHGITLVQFDSSYSYYMRHMVAMDRIYLRVVDSLNVKFDLQKTN